MPDIEYYGTGRRKSSTARVYLRPGTGSFVVNGTPFEKPIWCPIASGTKRHLPRQYSICCAEN